MILCSCVLVQLDAVLTDGASYAKLSTQGLLVWFRHTQGVVCWSHALNLVAEAAIHAESAGMKSVVAFCKAASTLFSQSNRTADRFRAYLAKIGAVEKTIPPRWNEARWGLALDIFKWWSLPGALQHFSDFVASELNEFKRHGANLLALRDLLWFGAAAQSTVPVLQKVFVCYLLSLSVPPHAYSQRSTDFVCCDSLFFWVCLCCMYRCAWVTETMDLVVSTLRLTEASRYAVSHLLYNRIMNVTAHLMSRTVPAPAGDAHLQLPAVAFAALAKLNKVVEDNPSTGFIREMRVFHPPRLSPPTRPTSVSSPTLND